MKAGEESLFSSLTLLGILLIILGAALLLIPLVARMGFRLEELPPYIFMGKRFDGLYLGTSPILIAILIIVYLLLFLRR